MAGIIYFSHGGGPLHLPGDPGHKDMVSFMKKPPEKIRSQTLQRKELLSGQQLAVSDNIAGNSRICK